jgi:hypothetical protein
MPPLPELPLVVTRRAHQRLPTAAWMVALARGAPRQELDRPPYDPGDLGERLAHQTLHLCTRLRRLHPLGTSTVEALGTAVRPHTPKKGVDLDRLACHPCACVGTGVRGALVPVIAVDTPARERRAPHVCGQIPRQAFLPRRPLAWGHVGDNPMALSRGTRLDQPLPRLGLHRLPPPRQHRPLPLRA